MFCSECGKSLNPGDKFCSRCGSRVSAQDVTASYHNVPPKHNAQDVVRPQAVPTPPPRQEAARYCKGCGQKMAPQNQFCMNCGWRAGSGAVSSPRQAQPVQGASSAPVQPAPAQPVKKKASKMKIWGIVLVVLQLMVVLGSLEEMATMGIFELLGFLAIGIIGVILLIRDYNKNKQ